MRVTPYGAVRTVTGSMHLVETAGVRLLLDCGLYQGRRADFYEVNRVFPFAPSSIDAVLLSHAHLDHCGNLPTLVTQGFTGSIYCTPATGDLSALVLRDSAKVQHQDVAFVNKIRRRRGEPPVAPLYTHEQAERAIRQLTSVRYGRAFSIGPARITFLDAGHILGSAITVVESEGRTLGFSGDLGRPGAPILRDPEIPPALDLLLMETTYGDRRHDPFEQGSQRLAAAVATTIRRGGKVLIPSFALGRAQDLAYTLRRLRAGGMVPSVPTYVDSPMAVDATEIYRVHAECFDEETRALLEQHDPFGFKELHYVRAVEESQALNEMADPFVVIATSGMCESGRILHHLRQHVGDPRSSLLIVSFQAAHTLGRRLADGTSPVRIFGEPHDVKLQVHVLHTFSAHADRDELLAWLKRLPRVGKVLCVHGEERPSRAFAERLAAQGVAVRVPERGEQITL
ncbi:MAG TPA: MBL fold metallo-hydrolase [bacterium]|nr:MBL fold metallo-hydrolase [bacterium]